MNGNLFDISLDNLSGSMMLTIEPKAEMVINEFCCEMIKKTDVFGLLKLNVTTIDGKVKFNYDLSKKKSLAEFAKAGFSDSYGRRILYNLCNAFLKLNEYYLKPTYCLLDPDYTYIGDGLNVYLAYIPVKDVKTDTDELKQYFSELLSKYFAVEGVAAYDEMFKYVYQCQTLDLSHFVSRFLASEEQSQNNFMAEKMMQNNMQAQNINPVPQAAPMPKPAAQNMPRPEIKPQQMNAVPQSGGIKMPGGNGFKMPGGGNMKMPGGNEIKMPGGGGFKMPGGNVAPKAPEKEKKGLFGLGGKKPPMPNQVMPNPPMQGVPNNIPNRPNNMQNFNIPNQAQNIPPQNNFNQGGFQQNMPPRFPSGMQNSMDKTIMMDGLQQQMQNMNMMGSPTAYLQYRGQNIPINDSEFVIGKANNQYKVNFVINNNPHVSRKHATILMQGNSFYIRDEGSTNGTYVNGRSLPKMVPQPLQNGDEISIYDEVFIFCS